MSCAMLFKAKLIRYRHNLKILIHLFSDTINQFTSLFSYSWFVRWRLSLFFIITLWHSFSFRKNIHTLVSPESSRCLKGEIHLHVIVQITPCSYPIFMFYGRVKKLPVKRCTLRSPGSVGHWLMITLYFSILMRKMHHQCWHLFNNKSCKFTCCCCCCHVNMSRNKVIYHWNTLFCREIVHVQKSVCEI